MGTVTNWIPKFLARTTASFLLPSEEYGPGMETPSTFSAPAQSDQHLLEAALLDVVVRSGDQRTIGISDFFVWQGVEFTLPRGGVEEYEVLLKRKCLRGDLAVRGQGHAGSVKNQAVVSP